MGPAAVPRGQRSGGTTAHVVGTRTGRGAGARVSGPANARVVGVDPGLVTTGYGVIEARDGAVALLEAGLIETQREWPLDERVTAIYERVAALLSRHTPAVLVLEDLYSEYRFPRTALLMAHARGVVCLAARQWRVTVLALSPAEVKRAIAGHGGAAKAQIQRGVQYRLRLDTPPRSSHVADALALALTGLGRLGGGA